MSYTPLDQGFLHSTVIGHGPVVVAVWALLLASRDRFDESDLTAPAIANLLRINVEQVEEAFQVLCSPDPYSRNKADKGIRLQAHPNGRWFIVSGEKYRVLASKAAAAERKARFDKRKQAEKEGLAYLSCDMCDRKAVANVGMHRYCSAHAIQCNEEAE